MIISKNAVAIIVLFLSFIGIEVGEDTILEVISAILTIVGFVLMVWNQVSRQNVENFFFKKK
jgi:hypothetical protein